jgi:hypothetical protein
MRLHGAPNAERTSVCDGQILGLRKRMEEMQHEFADLLKEALAKMHQRLEASHSSYMT